MRAYLYSAAVILSGSLLAACLGTGEDRITTIDATGIVDGIVYIDVNGNRELDQADSGAFLVGVRLLVFGTQDTASRTLTDRQGLFLMPAVSVGLYEVVVDPATVPDSLMIVDINPAEILSSRDDTTTTTIALSFPKVTVEEARNLPAGERVFADGVALNGRETYGDQTVHIAAGTWAIRSTKVGNAIIFAGDSVRFLGTTSTLLGQPTLDEVTPFLLAVAEVPPAVRLTTARASTADSARFDAALAQIAVATITDTATVPSGFALSVDDGSGPLRVLLDSDIRFVTDTLPVDSVYVPGVVIHATGLLVPIPSDTTKWELKPRSNADLEIQ